MRDAPSLLPTGQMDDVAATLSPSRLNLRSPPRPKQAYQDPKRRITKRLARPNEPMSTSRLDASLRREVFEPRVVMAQQRQERHLEGPAEERPRVELRLRPEAAGMPRAQSPVLVNPTPTTPSAPSGRLGREAGRSVQVPTGHRGLLPTTNPVSKLGKRTFDDFQKSGALVALRPSPLLRDLKRQHTTPEHPSVILGKRTSDDLQSESSSASLRLPRPPQNLKRARFIENSLAAIREHQQRQIPQEGKVGAMDRGRSRQRQEVARSIQIPPGLHEGKGEARPSAEEIANRRVGKLFHTAPEGLIAGAPSEDDAVWHSEGLPSRQMQASSSAEPGRTDDVPLDDGGALEAPTSRVVAEDRTKPQAVDHEHEKDVHKHRVEAEIEPPEAVQSSTKDPLEFGLDEEDEER